MGIFIYNHRTNKRIDIPEGYAPIPNDFPVEEGDLTYVSNPFSKPGIVDVLVPEVWVVRLGENSWISESISIRPIDNKKQPPTIFDYIFAINKLADKVMRSYSCDADEDATTQDSLEAELLEYLNSEQFSEDMFRSRVALIKETIQKRKESAAVPPGKLKLFVGEGHEFLSLKDKEQTKKQPPTIFDCIAYLVANNKLADNVMHRNACESCTKQNAMSQPVLSIKEIVNARKRMIIKVDKNRLGSMSTEQIHFDTINFIENNMKPFLPGRARARRYFRGKNI